MKIAFKLDVDGNITDIAEYPSSLYQDKNKCWIIVEDNPAFLIAEKFNWTIRPVDNVLVHKSTNKTPDEEQKDMITQLTLQNLQLVKVGEELKSGLTVSTKQNLTLTAENIQLKKDSADVKSGLTALTKIVMDNQSKVASDTDTATTDTTTTDNGGK